jgi:hypothetical protein
MDSITIPLSEVRSAGGLARRKLHTTTGSLCIAPVLFLLLLLTCNSKENASGVPVGRGSSPAPEMADSAPVAPQNLLSATSNGGTITFQNIGATGWYPSRRDPTAGPCDVTNGNGCCQTKHYLTNDSLTPWNEELIMTLRGPMIVKQVAAYQPSPANPGLWVRASLWDDKNPSAMQGIAFKGNTTENNGFQGIVGNTCLVDVSSNKVFMTGAGSLPYCPAMSDTKYYGWAGSKMIIVQASMPRVGSGVIASAKHCGVDTTNNWYDAPWIGFSHGEMVRSGAFGTCHCYAKDAAKWWLADGCGQFNAFEIVNDNNSYQNFDLFSTNFFGYAGYVGEGPCGKTCMATGLDSKVDLFDKATGKEASTGALASPTKGPAAAFRRPTAGYRYFVVLFDVKTRIVQMALINPLNIPAAIQGLLPTLPDQVARSVIDNVLSLRLPKGGTAVIR